MKPNIPNKGNITLLRTSIQRIEPITKRKTPWKNGVISITTRKKENIKHRAEWFDWASQFLKSAYEQKFPVKQS